MTEEEMKNVILTEARRHLEIARLDRGALDAGQHMKLAAAMLWLLAVKESED